MINQLGKEKIVIDQNDFFAGMSTSKDMKDGGYSPLSGNFNMKPYKGILQFAPPKGSITTNLVGTPFASYVPDNGYHYRVFVTDSNRIQGISSPTSITNMATITGTLDKIKSDIIQFGVGTAGNDLFVTTSTNIVKATGTGGSVNNTWWTVTQGRGSLVASAWHGMTVYENNLFIADANFIHKWNGSTSTYQALTLPYQQWITAFGLDPSTGKMMIAVKETGDSSAQYDTKSKILLWDGFSNKPVRVVPINGLITSLTTLGGVVYMCVNNVFGYWNGAGFVPLRDLNIDWNSDYFVWKNRITVLDNSLYICEGKSILVYGEMYKNGPKKFYYLYNANAGTTWTNDNNYIHHIMYASNSITGSGKEMYLMASWVASTSSLVNTWNVNNTSATAYQDLSSLFRSNVYEFSRPVIVREVLVQFSSDSVFPTTQSEPLNCIIQDNDNGNVSQISGRIKMDPVFTKLGRITVNSQKPLYSFEFRLDNGGIGGNYVLGIKRIIIYYDYV